jgi:hypothetical protein
MMSLSDHTICPGCGLRMPRRAEARYEWCFHASPECWSICTEVLGSEFGNAVLFGQVHQLTVDTYAVQHAGGPHPDKSVAIHLAGLRLMLERGFRPTRVPPLLQRLSQLVEEWPHFDPPEDRGPLTVFDVALAGSDREHIETVDAWARKVWDAWSPHHVAIAGFVERYLKLGEGTTT